MNSVMAGQVVMASLVGHALAVDKTLITLPIAIQMVAMMCASIPASMIFARLGRKPGFWCGCLGSLLGSLTYALGRLARQLRCCTAWARCPAGTGLGHRTAPALRRGRSRGARGPAARHLPGAGRRRAGGDHRAGDRQAQQYADPADGVPGHLSVPDRAADASPRSCCISPQLPPAIRQQGRPVPIRAILARPSFVTAVVASTGRLRHDEPGDGLDAAADADVRLRRGRQRRRDPRALHRDVPAGLHHRAADPALRRARRSSPSAAC